MEQILLETMQRLMEKVEVVDDVHQGFTKGKSCLTDAVAFCDGVAVLVHEGRGTDLIYLNLGKGFVAALHGISHLERQGFDRGTTWWAWNCLDGPMQRVGVNRDQLQVTLLRGWHWGQYWTWTWDQGTLSQAGADTQLCGEVTPWRGEMGHPEGPGQAGEVGLWEKSSTKPSASAAPGSGH